MSSRAVVTALHFLHNLQVGSINLSVCSWKAFSFLSNVCGKWQDSNVPWSPWKVLHSGRIQHYSQTLFWSVKACQRQTLVYWTHSMDIESLQNRLLKVWYVPILALVLIGFFFLLQPLTVLIKQTRQAVHAIKQSILLRCLWLIHKLQRRQCCEYDSELWYQIYNHLYQKSPK